MSGCLLIVPDYTSPTFFWTNIEISLGVITACTPTYRPLWLHWKKKRTAARKASHHQSFSFSGFPQFRAFRFRGEAIHGEEDNAQLNRDVSVNTFIGTGNLDARDHMDIGSVSVKHDIHTDSSYAAIRPDCVSLVNNFCDIRRSQFGQHGFTHFCI